MSSNNGTPVSVTVNGSRVIVDAPYHPQFPARAKAIGGRFDGATKTWSFDARDEAGVREMCIAIYGTDRSATAELVTVRVNVESAAGDELYIAGRQIARRPGRDIPVRLGAGVVIVSGGFAASGGSVKNPGLAAKPGTVLEIRDIPRAALAGIPERYSPEVVEMTVDRDALIAERERLVARLAEIDALLS